MSCLDIPLGPAVPEYGAPLQYIGRFGGAVQPVISRPPGASFNPSAPGVTQENASGDLRDGDGKVGQLGPSHPACRWLAITLSQAHVVVADGSMRFRPACHRGERALVPAEEDREPGVQVLAVELVGAPVVVARP